MSACRKSGRCTEHSVAAAVGRSPPTAFKSSRAACSAAAEFPAAARIRPAGGADGEVILAPIRAALRSALILDFTLPFVESFFPNLLKLCRRIASSGCHSNGDLENHLCSGKRRGESHTHVVLHQLPEVLHLHHPQFAVH